MGYAIADLFSIVGMNFINFNKLCEILGSLLLCNW